jgi:hypothetical protein
LENLELKLNVCIKVHQHISLLRRSELPSRGALSYWVWAY